MTCHHINNLNVATSYQTITYKNTELLNIIVCIKYTTNEYSDLAVVKEHFLFRFIYNICCLFTLISKIQMERNYFAGRVINVEVMCSICAYAELSREYDLPTKKMSTLLKQLHPYKYTTG